MKATSMSINRWMNKEDVVHTYSGIFISVQFTQSCPTLCNLMNHSMPGLPVHHKLPEFTQTHAIMSQWCHPAISSSVVLFSSCPQSLPASGSFPMSQLFAWGGQSIGVSASASVLLMNTQDLSPSGWTGCYSAIKKKKEEWSNVICSNTDEPIDYHTKWSQSDRERQITCYHLYIESKTWYRWIYLQNRNRFTDLENKFMVIGGMSWEKDRVEV